MVLATTERLFFICIILFLLIARQASLLYILTDATSVFAPLQDDFPLPKAVARRAWRNPTFNDAEVTRLSHSRIGDSSHASILQLMKSTTVFNDRQSKPTIVSNIIRRDAIIDRDDITLVLHLNVNKFHVLLTSLKYWSGPASVAVYLTTEEDVHVFFGFVEAKRDLLREASFHLILEKRPDEKWPYAHNILRNVAIDMVESDYFAAFDVDFIPSPRLHHYLRACLRSNATTFRNELRRKTLFVIPAFELYPRPNETYASESMIPQSAAEVVAMLHNNTLTPFRKSFPVSHTLTDFPRWIEAVEAGRGSPFSYPISFKNAKDKERRAFEPYIVGYRRGLPRYWEELRGYGYNKRSFIQECRIAGFTFAGLNNVYCVHLDHPEVTSSDREFYEDLNEPHYHEFVFYLANRYNMTKGAIKKLVGKWKVDAIMMNYY